MPDQDLCQSLQQCQKKTVRWPGVWRLAPKRAISLMPRQPSQILIVQGHAWITWEVTAGHGPGMDTDRFLIAGESMDVPAGVRLVMESLSPDCPVDFDWRAMPVQLQHASPRAATSLPVLMRHWLRAWLQLGQASAMLLQGLVRQGMAGSRQRGADGPCI